MAELGGELTLTIIRVAVGLIVAGHGAQKLFGWYGGQGLEKWSAAVTSMGFAQPRVFATLAAFAEFFGGLLFAIGLLTPLVAAALAVDMIVAIAKTHLPRGFWITKGGYEYALTFLVVFIAVGMHGAPRYSLDEFFGVAPYSAGAFLLTFVACGAITWLGMVLGPQRPSPERTRSV